MKYEVNCLNTKAIIEYIQQENSGALEHLFDNLDPEINVLHKPLEFLSDTNNWVSVDVMKKLFEKAKIIMEDEEVAFKIGFNSVLKKRLGYIQKILLLSFSNPKTGLKKAQEINDKFNKTKQVELKFLKRNKAVLHLYWFNHMNLSKDFCLINQGIYSAIPLTFNLPPAKLIETKCYFNGDECCEYQLEWKDRNLIQDIFLKFYRKNFILKEAIREVEKDKDLLQKKYNEINDLNTLLQRKIRQLKAIQHSSQVIASLIDQNNLLELTMNIFTNILHFDRAVIFLIDKGKNELKYAHAVGESKKAIDKLIYYAIPLHKINNMMVQVANSGKPVFIDDIQNAVINPNNFIIKQFHPTTFVIVPLISNNKIIGILGADRKTRVHAITEDDKEYLMTLANQIAIAIDNARLYNDLKDSYINSVQALVQALEAKDPYTRGHSERVTAYARKIALKMHLPVEIIEEITKMSILHDIGKIGIHENILSKKEKITQDELIQLRQHPEIGEKILKHIIEFNEHLSYIRHHHERYDGQGYPDGLSGSDIPVGARIICIADSYDAMTSNRSYRLCLTIDEAIYELKKNAGIQFDPDITSIFIEIIEQERRLN